MLPTLFPLSDTGYSSRIFLDDSLDVYLVGYIGAWRADVYYALDIRITEIMGTADPLIVCNIRALHSCFTNK